MLHKIKTFVEEHEWTIPLGLFTLFLIFTLPGISWGAPSAWHPDEIVVRSIKALHGEWKFSEINFDYPDLPQYTMFFLGKILVALGKTDGDILIASRVLSAVLAGLTIILTYNITRRIGGSIFTAGLSGLLLISVSEMAHNGRFAHNDTYLVFFVTLSVLCLLNYSQGHSPEGHRDDVSRSEESLQTFKRPFAAAQGDRSQGKLWLYVSFLTIGMAASSKYIGGSLVLAPLTIYLFEQRNNIRKQWFSIAETLFVSVVITFLGFGLGTPKALFWMTYYFKRLIPTLQWQVSYGHQPDSVRGISGQYSVMANGLGFGLMLLFGAGFVWAVWKVVKAHPEKSISQQPQTRSFTIISLSILVLDLPMMISYNYQLRYFLTLMPFLAILTAFFITYAYDKAKETNNKIYPIAINLTASAVILFSLARNVSLMLVVMNDARIPATAFMDTLPAGKTLEHTNYPPTYDGEQFEREHNYPIYFVRGDEPLPISKRFIFNAGEAGLDDRQTDYFIVDDFTANKFENQYFCDAMPLECDFFKQLKTGQSDHYKLLKEFKYTLPPYLPQISFEFINPTIRIYERIQ